MVQGESPKEQKELLIKARPNDSEGITGDHLDIRFGKSYVGRALDYHRMGRGRSRGRDSLCIK
jgi:hypothetical protein